jgi:S1-C subfamily serine protease
MNQCLRVILCIHRNLCQTIGAIVLSALVSVSSAAEGALTETIAKIKPSIVGVGTFQKTRNPSTYFKGTGFAVADGLHIVTNAHVLPPGLRIDRKETLVVLIAGSTRPENRNARIVAVDQSRDLALLQIDGHPLPALAIGDSSAAREGQALAFTGFPLGMALGLHPATHRATLAAIVPIARPGITAKQLNPRLVTRLRGSAYIVFQLDATAYPGNSGSPLFDTATGQVYGIINSVFIQGTREQAISQPSGITYAIPSKYIQDLLAQAKLRSSQ